MKIYILVVLIISLLLIPLVSAENTTDTIVPILVPAPIVPPPPTDIQTIPPITTISTPEPTRIPTTIITQTLKPTIKPTPISTQMVEDPFPKFVGVLCIAMGICVLGAIITYFILTRKMKREDEEEIIL